MNKNCFAGRHTALDDFDRSIIRSYINAPAVLRQYIRTAIMEAAATKRKVWEGQQAFSPAETKPPALTIDEKVAAYRRELEEEEKGKARSSASPDAEESA